MSIKCLGINAQVSVIARHIGYVSLCVMVIFELSSDYSTCCNSCGLVTDDKVFTYNLHFELQFFVRAVSFHSLRFIVSFAHYKFWRN